MDVFVGSLGRQREPYVNHLLRVALRIICHYGVDDVEVICAAVLHDAVTNPGWVPASTTTSSAGRTSRIAWPVTRGRRTSWLRGCRPQS